MMKNPKLLRFKINVVFFMIKDALSTLLPVYPELLKLKDGVYSKFSNLDSNGQPGKNTLW